MTSNGSYLFPEHAHEDPEDNPFKDRESSPDDFLDPVEIEEVDET